MDRVAGRTFSSLDEMMSSYAGEAVRIALADYGETLDYRPGTLPELERILNRLSPAPGPLEATAGEQLTMLWGSYFGEVLRRAHGGEWTMSLYPGTRSAITDGASPPEEFAVPTVEVGGSRLYPLLKVHRRLTLGAGEDVERFYGMVASRLAAAGTPIATDQD